MSSEVLCRLCRDFHTVSQERMVRHAAGWCENAVPMSDALDRVPEWFEDDEHEDGEDLEEHDASDDEVEDQDEAVAAEDVSEDEQLDQDDDNPEDDRTIPEIVHELVQDLAEPGETFETSELQHTYEAHTGDSERATKRVDHGLRTLREKGTVEDAGYGKWRRATDDGDEHEMAEGRNEAPHRVDEDLEDDEAPPSITTSQGGGDAVTTPENEDEIVLVLDEYEAKDVEVALREMAAKMNKTPSKQRRALHLWNRLYEKLREAEHGL